MPTIPRMPAAARQYIDAFNLLCIAITSKSRIVVTRDPRGHRSAWWTTAAAAPRVVAEVLRAKSDEEDETLTPERRVVLAAARLRIPLTDHLVVLERVARASARLEALLAQAEDDGFLQFFNRSYRAQRLAAQAAGLPVVPYSIARKRLKRALARAAASGGRLTTTSLVAEALKRA